MDTERCCSCSKEQQDRIPIVRVISKLDDLFSRNDLSGAARLLEYWSGEADMMGDRRGKLEILSEQIGLYRRTNERDHALDAVELALKIIESEALQNSVSTGTIYVNIATTLKAFGKAKEGMPYYKKAEEIYESADVSFFKKAALNNNMASAYAEIGDTAAAETHYLKAIELLDDDCEFYGEIAVSYVNLAHLYADMAKSKTDIASAMDKAWDYLNRDSIKKDGNYAFICSKCAPSFAYFGFEQKASFLEGEAKRIYEGA